jgi:hypothetical protein
MLMSQRIACRKIAQLTCCMAFRSYFCSPLQPYLNSHSIFIRHKLTVPLLFSIINIFPSSVIRCHHCLLSPILFFPNLLFFSLFPFPALRLVNQLRYQTCTVIPPTKVFFPFPLLALVSDLVLVLRYQSLLSVDPCPFVVLLLKMVQSTYTHIACQSIYLSVSSND